MTSNSASVSRLISLTAVRAPWPWRPWRYCTSFQSLILQMGLGQLGWTVLAWGMYCFEYFPFLSHFPISQEQKKKKEIWKFSQPSHGFSLPSLYHMAFRLGFLAWEPPAAALSRHCTKWFPRHCLISRDLLAQVPIGTVFCSHLLGAMCLVPLKPPVGALHSTAVRSWGRFTQIDSKLVITNIKFQCWVLLYSGI